MSKNTLSSLSIIRQQQMIATLTPQRLSKYLASANGHQSQALRLYILNAKVSAAFLTDVHYVEVALRNKFDVELARGFNTQDWFVPGAFTVLLDQRGNYILSKAQGTAAKGRTRHTPAPTGKVIAELTFGFWVALTNPKYEHTLWTPYLHKIFSPNPAPRRAAFNAALGKIQTLRNRIAHHEPIFHMNLIAEHRNLCEVARLLCPTTAIVLENTSSVKREIMAMSRYRSYQGI